MVEQHLDIERLLELAAAAAPLDLASPANLKRSVRSVRVALAGDEAFCFYYPDNLALLEAAGAELVSFSPLRDAELPAEVQGVYLGGGYPELHAARLAGNTPMRQAVRALALQGVPLYAECGGFMYLCESLIDADGEEHSMVGVVPGRCIMERELQAIGYREVTCLRDTVLGPLGTVVRGHEFHHSRFEGAVVPAQAAFRVGERHVGFAHANVLTSYVHLHFGSNPSAAESFVQQCLAPR
jgi:cobyrinic acid a,c-diamide synthase